MQLKLKKRPVIINLLANCSYDGNAKIQKESLWWNECLCKSALSFGASRRLTHVISEGFLSQYKIISKILSYLRFTVPKSSRY